VAGVLAIGSGRKEKGTGQSEDPRRLSKRCDRPWSQANARGSSETRENIRRVVEGKEGVVLLCRKCGVLAEKKLTSESVERGTS